MYMPCKQANIYLWLMNVFAYVHVYAFMEILGKGICW